MKKRLAKWFLLVAKCLDPEIRVEKAQVIEDYEARKIGITYEVTKKEIKDFRSKNGANMSLRKGKTGLFHEVMKDIRMNIIKGIDANNLMEYDVKNIDGSFIISGELKVYVPKKKKEHK